MVVAMVMRRATPSAMGEATKIPSIPINVGRMTMRGVKQSKSRTMDPVRDSIGFPTA